MCVINYKNDVINKTIQKQLIFQNILQTSIVVTEQSFSQNNLSQLLLGGLA
jgi:hypothetical protein